MVLPLIGIVSAAYAAYKAFSDDDEEYDEDELAEQRNAALAKARAAKKKKAAKRQKFIAAQARMKQSLNDAVAGVKANAGIEAERYFNRVPLKIDGYKFADFNEDMQALNCEMQSRIQKAADIMFKQEEADCAADVKEIAKLLSYLKKNS